MITSIDNTYLTFFKLCILVLIRNVDHPAYNQDTVLSWEAELIEVCDTKLLFENAFNNFKLLLQILSSRIWCKVEELIRLELWNFNLEFAILIVCAWDFSNHLIECGSLLASWLSVPIINFWHLSLLRVGLISCCVVCLLTCGLY